MTADADRPADVREVIARALLDLAGARAVLPTTQQADAVLAALSSAGLAVVPAGERERAWRDEDGEIVQPHDWRPPPRYFHAVERYVGPWLPVSPEPEGTGP